MMKVDYKIAKLTAIILVISLLLGSFSVLIVEATEEAYTLHDSLVMDTDGNWVSTGVTYNNHNGDYNCYAYAIGRVESKFYNLNDKIDNKIQYQPGDIFTNIQDVSARGSNNIDLLRCTVIKDLVAMGYTYNYFF